MNGSAGRDLERMFDLELDTDKNQYETGESASSAGQQQKALDEALQRLQMLAKRQQELAAQRQQQAAFSQRWEEEMLRREAEKLEQQMRQLSQNSSSRSQSSQQSGQQQANGQQSGGQQSSSSQSAGSQSSSSRLSRQQNAQSGGRASGGDPRIQQAMDALRRAEDEMRKAVSEHDPGAEQRAASELQQAQNLLRGMSQQRAGDSLSDMAQRAQQLAQHQEDFAKRLKQAFPENGSMPYFNNRALDPRLQGRGRRVMPSPAGTPTEQGEKLAAEKEKMAQELEAIQRQMQDSAQSLAAGQPDASSKLRKALSDAEQEELALRMKKNAEFIREGYAPVVSGREDIVTMGLDQLSQNLKEAQAAVRQGGPSQGPNGEDGAARALAAIQQLRQQLEARAGQPGEQQTREGTPNGQGGSGRPAIDRGAVQDALRELSGVQQRLGPRDRQFRSDVGEALRYFGHLNYATPGLLDARLNQEVLPALERLELDLKRQAGQQGDGSRTGAPERVPEGYRDSVAEYFRRLSK